MAYQARGALNRVSPIVAFVYATFEMLCVMVAYEPICIGIAFCSTVSLSCLLDGWRKTSKRLSWQLSVILVFALLNCAFAQRGATVLFSLAPLELRLESLVYGACIGTMIICAMNCFMLLSEVVSTDEALVLFGGKLPVVSLVASMSIRLVPRFQRQSKELAEVRKACTCAKVSTGKPGHEVASGRLTHLLASSLEDSLIAADSMRARGWGSTDKRTTYGKTKMTGWDVFSLIAVIALGLACLFAGWSLSSDFQFYPRISFVGDAGVGAYDLLGLSVPVFNVCGYSLYAIFFFLPHFALLMEAVKWKR